MQKRLTNILPYILLVCVFYVLDRENTFINDDLNYMLTSPGHKPIQNFGEILSSRYYDYFHQNGRFLVHVIVQLFCSLIGPKVFWIFNSLVFAMFIKQLCNYIERKTGIMANYGGILLLSIIVLVPAWHITFLGNISGAVNYLWSGLAYIWFINYYETHKDKKQSLLMYVLIFVLSIIIGSLQESFGIGIAGYLFFSNVFNLKNFKNARVPLVLGFGIGACICIFSPANFIRLDDTTGGMSPILKYATGLANVLVNSKAFMLMLFTVLILYIKGRTRVLINNLVKSNLMILTSACINVLFVTLIAFTGVHQLTSIELFSTTFLLIILLPLLKEGTFKCADIVRLNYASTFIILIFSCFVFHERHLLSAAYQKLLDNAAVSTTGIVDGSDYHRESTRERGWLRSNFLRSQEPFVGFNRESLSYYLSNGERRDFIHTVLPDKEQNIISSCVTDNKVSERVFYNRNLNYYIVVISKNEPAENYSVKVGTEPVLMGKIRNKLFGGNKLNYTIKPVCRFDNIEYQENLYYIISEDKNFTIKDIELCTD